MFNQNYVMMKAKHIKQFLGVSDDAIEEQMVFNPLTIVAHEEFSKPSNKSSNDYRKRAIERCLDAKVPFQSDSNTIYECTQLFITIKNPFTGREMKVTGGGGNSELHTINFVDDVTLDKISLTFPTNGGISIQPHLFDRYNKENPIPVNER